MWSQASPLPAFTSVWRGGGENLFLAAANVCLQTEKTNNPGYLSYVLKFM